MVGPLLKSPIVPRNWPRRTYVPALTSMYPGGVVGWSGEGLCLPPALVTGMLRRVALP